MPGLIPGFTTRMEYPTSDGKPTAETDTHRHVMTDLLDRLQAYCAATLDVYVSGNLLVDCEEGNAGRHLSPDCLVVFGVPKGDRDTFRTPKEIESNADGSIVSRKLALTFSRDGTRPKLQNATTGAAILTEHEAEIEQQLKRVADRDLQIAKLQAEPAALKKKK